MKILNVNFLLIDEKSITNRSKIQHVYPLVFQFSGEFVYNKIDEWKLFINGAALCENPPIVWERISYREVPTQNMTLQLKQEKTRNDIIY